MIYIFYLPIMCIGSYNQLSVRFPECNSVILPALSHSPPSKTVAVRQTFKTLELHRDPGLLHSVVSRLHSKIKMPNIVSAGIGISRWVD